jgi:hypothetical protein
MITNDVSTFNKNHSRKINIRFQNKYSKPFHTEGG